MIIFLLFKEKRGAKQHAVALVFVSGFPLVI
jgi:hypothetical protein